VHSCAFLVRVAEPVARDRSYWMSSSLIFWLNEFEVSRILPGSR